MNDSDSEELSAKLRAWKVEAPLPTSFQREVWRRISVRQNAFWSRLMAWASALLARPLVAVALVIVSLSVSIGFAHVQARKDNAKHSRMLEARYAASIDPLAMKH
jgi:hypothetical protein